MGHGGDQTGSQELETLATRGRDRQTEGIKREADPLQDACDKVTAGNWSLETAVEAVDVINAGPGS